MFDPENREYTHIINFDEMSDENMGTGIDTLVVGFNINLSDFNKSINKVEKTIKFLGRDFETSGKKIAKSFASEIDGAVDKLNTTLEGLSKSGEETKTGFVDMVGDFSTVIGIFSNIKGVLDLFKMGGEAVDVVTTATKTATTAMGGLQAAAGPVALAIGAIALIVIGLIAAFSNAGTETRKLRKEIKETSSEIDEIKEKTAEQAAETEVNATAAQKLAKELYTLQGKEGKSNDEKKRMVALTEELNKLCPGLNLNLNKQTCTLDKQYDAVQNVIEGMKQKALTQIYEEEYVELLKKQIDLEKQYGKATDIVSEKSLNLAHAEEKAAVEGDFLGISVGSAQNAVNEATTAQKEAYDAWVENDKAMSDLEQTIGGLATSYGTTGDAIDTFTEDQIKNMESMGYSYDDLKTKDSDTLDQILSDWQDNQDAMQELLDERVGMTQNAFEKIDTAANNVSYSDMVGNMNANADTVSKWTENLNSLKNSKINKDFLKQIEDMGPEYAASVQNLVDQMKEGGDVDFSDINTAYVKSGTAAVNSFLGISGSEKKPDYTYSGLTGPIDGAAIGTEVQTQILSVDFTGTGATAMDNFITGMETKREALISEADSLIGDIVNKLTIGASSSESDSKDGKSKESTGAAAATNIGTEIKSQILSVDFTATGVTVMTNFMTGMESMREPLLDKVTSLLKSVAKRLSSVKFVVKISPTALQLEDRYHARGGIRKHAEGGITNGPMVMDIMGEAGAEALLPLESNTRWMDKIADKVAARMGSLKVDFTVNTPVTLDGATIAASQTKQTKILNLQTGAAVMGGI